MISLNPPLIVDKIDDNQKHWLDALASKWMGPVKLTITQAVFDVFKTRGWVEGEASGCRLTVAGWQAAQRIIGEKAIGKKKKKVHNKLDF